MKAKKLVCVATAAILTASMAAIFAGCGEENGDKLTVTWYDGRTSLKTEEVESGSKLTEWTPEKDGYEFKGWFAESSKTQKFDFTKAITEDTSVYSSWLKTEYVADTNNYCAIGEGAGTLKDSAWSHAPSKDSLKFVKDTSVTNANVYTITLVMYAGDRFQVSPGDWITGRAGIGNIEGSEYADFKVGENPYMLEASGTAADKDYAVVKNSDGEIVFNGGNENDDPSTNWNIVCTKGHDGKYKFTYHTYPGQEANNYLTWELVEALEPLTETHKMIFLGGHNGWRDGAIENGEAKNEADLLKKNSDGTFTGFVTLTETTELKLYNIIGDNWYGDAANGGNNFSVEAGTWCFTFNPANSEIKYKKCEYYVVGTFMDGTNQVNFSVKEGITPKMTTADGGATYTASVTAADVTASYTWISEQNKPGVFAIKVVFGCELGIKDWYADSAHNGDNFYLTAGSHTVTLTVEGGAVTVS